MGSVFIWAVAWCGISFAHPLDLGLARASIDGGRVTAEMRLHEQMAGSILGLSGDKLTELVLGSRAAELRDPCLGRILSDQGDCPWGNAIAARDGNSIVVKAEASCPASASSLKWKFLIVDHRAAAEGFRVLATVNASGEERVFSAEKGSDTIEFGARALGFFHFLSMGIAHIGAAPSEWHGPEGWHFPDGIDHILFVLAIVLTGGGLMRLAGTITGFTLGHSITLALASFRLVSPPSRLIESLIALSIAIVALEALLGTGGRHRWKVAAFFGLVHGFGFANALTELNLRGWPMVRALVGYNFGVEVGQLVIIACTFPLLALLARSARWGRVTTQTASTGIFLAGSYWFVRRAFGF